MHDPQSTFEPHFFNLSQALLAVGGFDGRLHRVNAAWQAVLGWTPEELTGRPWLDFVHPDDHEATIAAGSRLAEGQELTSFDNRYRHRNGSYRWLRWNANVSLEHQLTYAVVEDVTDRKAAEEALRSSEARYRSLFNSISQGFCVCEMILDAQGKPYDYRFLEVNPLFSTMTGLENAAGRTARELIPGLEPYWFELYGRVATTGEATHFVNGSEAMGRWFDVTAFRVGNHGDLRFAILFTDITEQRQIEAALHQAETRFMFVADSAPVLLWQTNTDGLVFVNRHFLQFVGEPFESISGRGWMTLVHNDDLRSHLAAFRHALRKEEMLQSQCRIRRADGEYRWLQNLGMPYRSSVGDFVGLIGCSVDITDVKLAEEASRIADRRKDEFLATLAHELRNPLAPLRNALHILRMTSDPSARKQAQILMERQLGHMVRLIDDLLDVSRISRGKIELRLETVDVAQALQGAIETSRPIIEAGGHEFSMALPHEAVYVRADTLRLGQIVSNLLNNAAKFTPAGGRVSIEVETTAAEVSIRISDTGVGIPREMLERIFDMFTQVDTSLERSRGGLGIGLSLVRFLVEMHGGSVEASSAGAGRGSAFAVRLPRESADD